MPKAMPLYYPYALTLLDTSTYPLFWTIDPPLPTTHASLEHPASAPAEGAIQLTCSTEAVPWKTWQAEIPPNSTWNLKMMVSKKKHLSFSYKLLFWGSLLNFRGVLHFYQSSNFRKENQRLDSGLLYPSAAKLARNLPCPSCWGKHQNTVVWCRKCELWGFRCVSLLNVWRVWHEHNVSTGHIWRQESERER